MQTSESSANADWARKPSKGKRRSHVYPIPSRPRPRAPCPSSLYPRQHKRREPPHSFPLTPGHLPRTAISLLADSSAHSSRGLSACARRKRGRMADLSGPVTSEKKKRRSIPSSRTVRHSWALSGWSETRRLRSCGLGLLFPAFPPLFLPATQQQTSDHPRSRCLPAEG